jgi:tetratricopeptide (TPR) repeat protein
MTGEYPRQRSSWPSELVLDDQSGPAAHITRAKSEALISSALLAAGFDERAPAQLAEALGTERHVDTVRPAPPRRRGWLWQAAAVAAMCFVGMGSASAAVMLWKRMVEPAPAAAPIVEKAPKPHRDKPVVVQEAPVEEVAPPVEVAPAEKPHAIRAPEDWLDDANGLRAKRKWRDADKLYARVVSTAPRSSAAYVARVASASVRLEHLHDPRGALARYRSALEQSPRGPLLEEIRFGIAESYRALGQRAEERKALESFVHDLPSSGLAKRAQARLDVLLAPHPAGR